MSQSPHPAPIAEGVVLPPWGETPLRIQTLSSFSPWQGFWHFWET